MAAQLQSPTGDFTAANSPWHNTEWRTLRRQLLDTLAARRREVDSLVAEVALAAGPVGGLDDLIAQAAGDRGTAGVVKALVRAHQAGMFGADLVLLVSRIPVLVNVSRHCHVAGGSGLSARLEEQMHATVAAFYEVLGRADADDKYVVHNLYWRSLHKVTDRRKKVVTVACGLMHLDGEDLFDRDRDNTVHNDLYRTEEVGVVDALLSQLGGRTLSTRDIAVLRAMYDREEPITVAEAAGEFGISEHAMESRVRRAVARLREAVGAAAATEAA